MSEATMEAHAAANAHGDPGGGHHHDPDVAHHFVSAEQQHETASIGKTIWSRHCSTGTRNCSLCPGIYFHST